MCLRENRKRREQDDAGFLFGQDIRFRRPDGQKAGTVVFAPLPHKSIDNFSKRLDNLNSLIINIVMFFLKFNSTQADIWISSL